MTRTSFPYADVQMRTRAGYVFAKSGGKRWSATFVLAHAPSTLSATTFGHSPCLMPPYALLLQNGRGGAMRPPKLAQPALRQ